MQRRTFVGGAFAGIAGAGCSQQSRAPVVKAGDIPKRAFGKTGEMLTVVGPGSARFSLISWEEATAITRRAYDLGVNYFDTSHNYWEGRSEEVYGEVLASVRKDVFITTKADERTREGAERELQASLTSLKTDHVDLWQLHKVGNNEDDMERIFAPGGAMEALVAAKEAGKCRFIGFTVHGDPHVVLEMLRQYNEWDATLIPLNLADPAHLSFEKIALPAVVDSGIGIQVMKSLANSKLLATTSVRDCVDYVLSLPIHCVTLGFTSVGQVDDDVRFAREFQPLTAEVMDRLRAHGARVAGPQFENWKTRPKEQAGLFETPLHDDV